MDQAIVNSAIAFTAASLIIILFRIFLRRLQHDKFLPDDWLMLISIIFYLFFTATYPIMVRASLRELWPKRIFWKRACMLMLKIQVYNGTNTTQWRESAISQDESVTSRVLGSKMMLVGRVFYTTYLWCLKSCVLIYYTRLAISTSEYLLVEIAAGTLAVTWLLAILSFFLECRPIELYWQVIPDTPPPECAKAVVELIVLESLNISTTVFLIVIPTPLLLRAHLKTKHKIWVSALFVGLSSIITISVLRMTIVTGNLTTQSEGLWAQIECFLATAVANAPSIHEMWRHGWGHVRTRKFGRDNCSDGYRLATILPMESPKINHAPFDTSRKGSRVPSQDGSGDSELDIDRERRQDIASVPGTESRIKLGLHKSIRKVGQKLRTSLENLEIQKSVVVIQERKTGRLTPPPDLPGPTDGEFFFGPNHGEDGTARIRTEVSCNKALRSGHNNKVPRSWLGLIFRGPEGCG
ncbi:uncharacterized protein RSE6_11103 [Rhynchosporium secalis]|uniref:Rhodopsin domain-containing protein n=1 Tax=Rhynchosporium secalis TaxID=38038 RepID=A0A1E1MM45_RHYSE|nr:uncharacterized protein RSE6_11103 [Rhynchosporium secalis]